MRSLLVHLILVLSVWHLGACPCGCADHNAWLEMVLEHHDSDPASALGISLDHEPRGISAPRHCDGRGRLPYLRNSRESELRVQLLSARELGHSLVGRDVSGNWNSAPALAWLLSAGFRSPPSSQPELARLQMWLI